MQATYNIDAIYALNIFNFKFYFSLCIAVIQQPTPHAITTITVSTSDALGTYSFNKTSTAMPWCCSKQDSVRSTLNPLVGNCLKDTQNK